MVSRIDVGTGRRRFSGSRVEPAIGPLFVGNPMRKFLNRFRKDEQGAALVEYGMLVGLIAVICVVAITLLGQEVSNAFSIIASDLKSV
jgi:pilus assembly protein Flp/PilA